MKLHQASLVVAIAAPLLNGWQTADVLSDHHHPKSIDVRQAPLHAVGSNHSVFSESRGGVARPLPFGQKELLCKLKSLSGFAATSYVETFGRLRKRWGKCAVVSNSGVLLKHDYGKDIDASDLVIRFNDAPIISYEHMVGHKDDLRITNNQFPSRVLEGDIGAYTVHKDAVTSYVIIPMGQKAPPRLLDFHNKFPKAELYKIDQAMLASLENTLRSIYKDDPNIFNNGRSFTPTAGAVGMIIAMTICEEVKAYGMAMTPNARSSPYSYYEKDRAQFAGSSASDNVYHKTFGAEKDLWRQLASNSIPEVHLSEVAVIPGFSDVQCGGDEHLSHPNITSAVEIPWVSMAHEHEALSIASMHRFLH